MRKDFRVVIWGLKPEIQKEVIDVDALDGESYPDLLRRSAQALELRGPAVRLEDYVRRAGVES